MQRRTWSTWSIQAKLLLAILLVLGATIVTSGVLFYLSSATAIERRTLALTGNTVDQMTTSIDFYVAEIDRLGQSAYNDVVVQRVLRASDPISSVPRQPHDTDDLNYRLLTLSTALPSIQGMYAFANDGSLFYFTRGQRPKPNHTMADEPWYERMRQQAAPPVLLVPTGAETTVAQAPQQVFSHVRLIKNTATGRKLGYLKIDLNIDAMHNVLALSPMNAQRAQVLVIDDNGQVIYHNAGLLAGQQLHDLRLANAASGQGRLAWRDQTYLYAAQRSAQTRWTTWMLIPLASVTGEVQQTGLVVLGLCLGAVVLLGGILYVVTQRVTQPLRQMAHTMARVQAGDLAVRVPQTRAQDELGRLSRGFNTMLDSLERMVTQVYEAKLREKDAQLLALQTQINPHFLFNTLNSMRALSRKQQADTVVAMTEALADLFRYSMSNWNEPVPLREELEHLQNYVMIQCARFGERFAFACEVPPDLLAAPVVKLSIQPLVENAITHALDRRPTGIRIVVRACVQDTTLAIEVTDNGCGIDDATLVRLKQALNSPVIAEQLPTADGGIGLISIDRRIKLLFGEGYGVAVHADPGTGTTVSLRLPYERNSAAEEQGAERYAYLGGRR